MLLLPSNTTNFIGRIFFILLTFFLFYLIFHIGLNDSKSENVAFSIKAIDFQLGSKYILYMMLGIIAYLAVLLIVSLLGINSVYVDTVSGTITFNRLFTVQMIATTDIISYSETTHRNSAKVFSGLLIEISSGETIQIAGQNVKRIADLKTYLGEKGIKQGKTEKMKFPFN